MAPTIIQSRLRIPVADGYPKHIKQWIVRRDFAQGRSTWAITNRITPEQRRHNSTPHCHHGANVMVCGPAIELPSCGASPQNPSRPPSSGWTGIIVCARASSTQVRRPTTRSFCWPNESGDHPIFARAYMSSVRHLRNPRRQGAYADPLHYGSYKSDSMGRPNSGNPTRAAATCAAISVAGTVAGHRRSKIYQATGRWISIADAESMIRPREKIKDEAVCIFR